MSRRFRKMGTAYFAAFALLLNLGFSPSISRAAEAETDCDKILDTMDNLRLSEDHILVEVGEFYELTVEPVADAGPLGWEIDQVEFSNPDLVVQREELPDGVVPTTTSAEELRLLQSIPEPAVKPADEESSDEDDEKALKIYLEGLKTGSTEIEVELANPSWESSCTHGHAKKLTLTCQTDTVPTGYKAALRAEAAKQQNQSNQSQLASGQGTTQVKKPADSTEGATSSTITRPQDPQPSIPSQPGGSDNPSDPGNPGGSDDPSNPSDPSNPDNPDNPDPGNPDNPDQPDQPDEPDEPELKKYDTSNWAFDPDQLSFVYDGQEHHPVLTGVPAEVTVKYSAVETNAGQYTYRVAFEVPEGYEDVPDMAVDYEITPLTPEISYQVDPVTGELKLVTAGILESDLDGEIKTSVIDATDSELSVMNVTPGYYNIKTQMNISEDKKQNYTIPEIDRSEYLNVTESQPWLNFTLDYAEENGQLIVKVGIKDLKIPQVGTYDKLLTGLKLFYDKDRLEYVSQQDGDWSQYIMDMMSMNRITAEYNGAVNSEDGPLPENSTIAILTFNYKDPNDKADLIFRTGTFGVRDKNPQDICPDNTYGQSPQRDFYYQSGGNFISVANPTGNIKLDTQVIESDPMDNAFYKGSEANRDDSLSYLQDYVDQHFNQSSDNEDPGTEDPGTEDPGNENPGTEDPGNDNPGTDDPANPDNPGGNTGSGSENPSNPNPNPGGLVEDDDADIDLLAVDSTPTPAPAAPASANPAPAASTPTSTTVSVEAPASPAPTPAAPADAAPVPVDTVPVDATPVI